MEERVEEDEPQPVALRYADAYQYQNIFAPLLKMEADYDKALKESQTRHGITVRWEMGLNRKRVAYFVFPQDESEVHLVPGDELRLCHTHTQPDGKRIQWECTGQVIRLTANEEVGLEMKSNANIPLEHTTGYRVDFVWKSTSFDRMQNAMKTFALDENSLSGFLYHKLLGHEVEEQRVRAKLPARPKAPGPFPRILSISGPLVLPNDAILTY